MNAGTAAKLGFAGGAGLVHFRDQDYRYMGMTEILLQLLLGELPMGTYNLEFQTAGHSGFAHRVGPVLKGITTLIKGVKTWVGRAWRVSR